MNLRAYAAQDQRQHADQNGAEAAGIGAAANNLKQHAARADEHAVQIALRNQRRELRDAARKALAQVE